MLRPKLRRAIYEAIELAVAPALGSTIYIVMLEDT